MIFVTEKYEDIYRAECPVCHYKKWCPWPMYEDSAPNIVNRLVEDVFDIKHGKNGEDQLPAWASLFSVFIGPQADGPSSNVHRFTVVMFDKNDVRTFPYLAGVSSLRAQISKDGIFSAMIMR